MTEDNSSDMDTELSERVRRGRPPKVRTDNSGPQREPVGRGTRIPLGAAQPKLGASQRPGYVRRWINDDRQRLQLAQSAGYEFVLSDPNAKSSDDGNKISQIVGSKDGGGGLRAYLMEIREEWYREDQAVKTQKIKATENMIKRGELTKKVGEDGAYIPSQGIKITTRG